MTWSEMIASDNVLVWAAGLAGAAAMAATDWRSPWRAAQHIFVGTLAAGFATPGLYPALSKIMEMASVPESSQPMSAGFITGAFAIYLFEFFKLFWRFKILQQKAEIKEGGDDA